MKYSTDEADLIGRVLDRKYVVDALLGRGAMGLVLGAKHVALDRRVAVKLLHPSLVALDEMRERFLREAQVGAEVSHDNLVDVVDYGVSDEGLHYLAMEYLEGADLYTWIKDRGRLSAHEASRIAVALCDALGALHASGYVHRDVKPENVWILAPDPKAPADAPQRIKLLDLGIAGLIDDAAADVDTRITRAGHTVGTVHYMSPEQALGNHADGRSDIYALGCILWELTAGACAFEGTSPMAVMMKHISDQAQPPSSKNPTLPRWFDETVLRCLAKDPGARFPTIEEARAAFLLGLESGDEVVVAGAIGDDIAHASGAFHTDLETKAVATEGSHWGRWLLAAAVVVMAAGVWIIGSESASVRAAGTTAGSLASVVDAPRGLAAAALPLDDRVFAGTALPAPAAAAMAPAAAVAPAAAMAPSAPSLDADKSAVAAVAPPVAVPEGSPDMAAASTPASAAKAKPRRRVAARKPAMVTLTFDVDPPGTVVHRGIERLGNTPLTVRVRRKDVATRYSFSHSGRKAWTASISHARPRVVRHTLSRLSVAPVSSGGATAGAGDSAADLMRPARPKTGMP